MSAEFFTVTQLVWLTGRWQGEHEGGLLDEQWMAPAGRSMLGISRLAFGEKTASAEFMLLEEREDGLFLTIVLPRTGRTELMKVTGVSSSDVVYEQTNPEKRERLTYRREADGVLYVLLEKEKEGRPIQTEFRMHYIGP